MAPSLNIVSFDVPFPANYGGVIDVYYKLYWLHKAGVKIHLHCFAYGREASPELAALCETVNYYPRKTGLMANLGLTPYTVRSRQSKELEENLLKNDYPILFEVLHTCYLLNDKRFAGRKKIYRHSNIEHDYYRELASVERGFIKKVYLRLEAWRLKRFEKILRFANLILAVNQKDALYFKSHYAPVKSVYLPSFHASAAVNAQTGKGDFILFHGNLSISENYEAAMWLIEHVFCKINKPVVIAGLNPPEFLQKACKKFHNVELRANPSGPEMNELIATAHVHVLYTAQPTGLKLKLLNVLFTGRFVIVNDHMLSGTGILAGRSLAVATSADDYLASINAFFECWLSDEDIIERKRLVQNFDNAQNAQKLLQEMF